MTQPWRSLRMATLESQARKEPVNQTRFAFRLLRRNVTGKSGCCWHDGQPASRPPECRDRIPVIRGTTHSRKALAVMESRGGCELCLEKSSCSEKNDSASTPAGRRSFEEEEEELDDLREAN